MRKAPTRTAEGTGERGQAVVEFAIIFPIQLMLVLCLVQLAQLFVARQVVSYAAFCAARAQLVGEDPQAAAALACTVIAGPAGVTPGSITLPGWGDVPGYNAALVKTHVRVVPPDGNTPVPNPVTVEVVHDYQLSVPIANRVAYGVGDLVLSQPKVDRAYGKPHLPIKATCTLAQPWQTAGAGGGP